MARVVQQRTSPPYLLIIVVFLFLIAATLAVLFYMEADKARAGTAEAQKKLQKLADADDLRDVWVLQMMKDYEDPLPGEARGKTVVKQLEGRIDTLTQLITGTAASPKDAEERAQAAFQQVGTRRGLVSELLDYYDQTRKLKNQAEELNARIKEKDKELGGKDQLVETVRGDLQSQIDALQTRAQAMDASLKQAHDDYRKQLDQARQEWEEARDDLNKNIAVKTRDITKLQNEKAQLEARIADLLRRIREATPQETDVAQSPDGKVLKILPEDNYCYINLGQADNVKPGLTFAVYPPTGIPEDGKGKAKIVVADVFSDTSGCRIVEQDKGDPMIEGDLAANLAFDRTRTYTFVVEGAFDLYNTGRPSRENAKDVEALIKRFGGKVSDKVDIDTDFIVLGQEPTRPPKPADVAPPQVFQVYQDQMKIYEQYEQVKGTASALLIPLLNTNRFLAFIGYTPTKAGS